MSLRLNAGMFRCSECSSRSQMTGNESSSSGGRGRGVLLSKEKIYGALLLLENPSFCHDCRDASLFLITKPKLRGVFNKKCLVNSHLGLGQVETRVSTQKLLVIFWRLFYKTFPSTHVLAAFVQITARSCFANRIELARHRAGFISNLMKNIEFPQYQLLLMDVYIPNS